MKSRSAVQTIVGELVLMAWDSAAFAANPTARGAGPRSRGARGTRAHGDLSRGLQDRRVVFPFWLQGAKRFAERRRHSFCERGTAGRRRQQLRQRLPRRRPRHCAGRGGVQLRQTNKVSGNPPSDWSLPAPSAYVFMWME